MADKKKSIDKNHDKKSVLTFEERWDKAVRFDRTEAAELANEKFSEENRYTDDEYHQEIRNLLENSQNLISYVKMIFSKLTRKAPPPLRKALLKKNFNSKN